MPFTIADIAARTGLEAAGDRSLSVGRAAEPAHAGAADLALAMTPAYEKALSASAARAAVLAEGADWEALGLEAALFAPRARVALSAVTGLFAPAPDIAPGIHPAAVIDPSARIGEGVAIGPCAVIGADVEIGAGSLIASHTTIGRAARLGEGCLVGPGCRIAHEVTLGARVRLHANVCLGGDGFSFVTPERGAVEAAKAGEGGDAARATHLLRIASLGGLIVGDDVEIGSGSCIDRGTVADTVIGAGTKIDNLVQIGHNVRVGSLAMICGHVGIAGSCRIGDRVVLGGKVGIGDHIDIGTDSVVAGGSLVGTNIAPGTIAMGVPAVPRAEFYRQITALRRLPRMVQQFREMRAKLGL